MAPAHQTELTELKDALPSMFLECALYGIFIVLFITSTCLLALRRRNLLGRALALEKKERFSLSLYLVLGIMMFLCLSGVWILSWLRLLRPELIDSMGSDSTLFFVLDFSDSRKLNAIIYGRGVLFVALSKVSDLTLTYRLWVISSGSFRVMAFPYLLWVGYLVTCVGLLGYYLPHAVIATQWLMALIVLSICLNVYFTGCVLYRVRQAREIVSYGGANIIRGMAIVVESAAIYTICLILLVIFSVAQMKVPSGLMADAVGPVAGIVTMLVNVRVGLGWAWGGPSPDPSRDSFDG